MPNTNGFIANGSTIKCAGLYKVVSAVHTFSHGNRTLKTVAWNNALLHILSADGQPLVGNAGFSYTLNATASESKVVTPNVAAPQIAFDSLLLVGRTPCGMLGAVQAGNPCYKIKWSVALYRGQADRHSGTYAIKGTAWRGEGTRRGTWRLVQVGKRQTIYALQRVFGEMPVYLLAASNNLYLFTGATGNPLVGNGDFSYTLNKLR
jgi:hypothetical protein